MEMHVGAVGPYKLEVTIESKDAAIDLNNVVSGSFEVQRETGDPVSWSGTVSGAATVPGGSKVTLSHTFVAGELPNIETLQIYARLSTASNTFYSEVFRLSVVGLFT